MNVSERVTERTRACIVVGVVLCQRECLGSFGLAHERNLGRLQLLLFVSPVVA